MRQVIESYALVITIALMCIVAIAFTSMNLNLVQARRIYNDIKAEVQASNGAIVPVTSDGKGVFVMDCGGNDATKRNEFINKHHYGFWYKIERMNSVNENITSDQEIYIYNNLYKITFYYTYAIPIFGKQVYPITGYVS